MWLELVGGHEPARLPDDGPEGAGIQFTMRGNRKNLTPGRRISCELDVAAVLSGDTKSESAEDTDDVIARKPAKRWPATAAPQSSRAASGSPAGRSQGVFAVEVESNATRASLPSR